MGAQIREGAPEFFFLENHRQTTSTVMKARVILLLVLIQVVSLHAQSNSTKEGTPQVDSTSSSRGASPSGSVVSTIASVLPEVA